ncbi:MAG: chemotaxis protein CheD [Gammaproteobacteria bacterium]|nr:chemotaxis protein CheD [Gammaproteobacteria bacterium]
MTAWHPKRFVGFMCHYMLASRPASADKNLDAKYGEDAIAIFLREADRNRTDPKDYIIKVFGGGNMFPKDRSCQLPAFGCLGETCAHVSCRNVTLGREILKQHGLKISAEHVGGTGHRQIIFDIWSGDVWMRHISIP